MAKRYFDTDIWKKKWFRSLSPKYKSVWWYIISQCDHAGFFEPDIEIMSIFIGEELDEKELMNIFDERIEYLRDDKWFIPKFIQFQYNVATPDELARGFQSKLISNPSGAITTLAKLSNASRVVVLS